MILYQNSDFNNELCTLTDMEELPPFATVRITEIVTEEIGTVQAVPLEFIIPKFDHDIEFLLAKGNAPGTKNGTVRPFW